MPNITFTKGSDTFTFSRGRSYPVDDPVQVNVPVGYSDGGQLYAYDKGIEEQFFNLVFERLSLVDFNNFGNWLLNIAVGPKSTFTYTDEDSADHTARLLDTKNSLKEISHERFSGTIRLRKEI
ncbi:MAG: hypothetical protein PF495_16110 [Spirochaetales bacterium]|jgi:hypothetical protein|nr:hypothetical protein [Spirochaetales bacterium]